MDHTWINFSAEYESRRECTISRSLQGSSTISIWEILLGFLTIHPYGLALVIAGAALEVVVGNLNYKSIQIRKGIECEKNGCKRGIDATARRVSFKQVRPQYHPKRAIQRISNFRMEIEVKAPVMVTKDHQEKHLLVAPPKQSQDASEEPSYSSQAITKTDDTGGHLEYDIGDILQNRYRIVSTLGEGKYSKVVQATDLNSDKDVAVKIMKKSTSYIKAARCEIVLMDLLSLADPDGKHLCVKKLDWFICSGHVCIVLELLGKSIYDFLERNNFEPYPLNQVRHIGYQLCHSVKFLHDLHIIHTDLKLENMMIVNSDYVELYRKKKWATSRLKDTSIKLIDFNTALRDVLVHDKPHKGNVSTRYYRAPEVILELGWSHPIDVWSIGCILFEMYSGSLLFKVSDNQEHLAMMEYILGPLPYQMCNETKTRYCCNGRLAWDEKRYTRGFIRKDCKPLQKYFKNGKEHLQLYELIRRMLEYEPSRRITLREALSHPFFANLPRKFKLCELESEKQHQSS